MTTAQGAQDQSATGQAEVEEETVYPKVEKLLDYLQICRDSDGSDLLVPELICGGTGPTA